MTFLNAIYKLIIAPLELLFEVIFEIANKIIGNAGLSIIFLSLAVSFLVLPLYKRADELQAEERDIQAKMAPWVKHIKKTFKGDERFLMLQEYYRINHYKPVYALKSSVSLLLQIPFFIAAYNLLSGMKSLQGMPFGFIADLGKEDALFMIGSFPVNILPILMTLVNIVSGIIYTKGHPLRAKIQVYGLAAVFLVLLYHSPSGLVFYWLLNNVFSLLKNVFYKLKDPKKVLSIVLAAAGLILLAVTVIRPDLDGRQKILLSIGSVLLLLPLVSVFLPLKKKTGNYSKDALAFFTGAILMSLITGLLIPSVVINDSALEFIDIMGITNPAIYVVNSMLLSFGTWVLWGGVFYFLTSDRVKYIFGRTIWIICGVSIIDYLLFGTDLGIMSSALQYEKTPDFGLSQIVVNSLVVIAVAAVFWLFYSKFRKIAKTVLIIGIMTVSYLGIMNMVLICQSYSWYQNQAAETSDELANIPLSKNGKNVIVLMLDRSMGTQVPYIMNEKPELKDKFDGFTYYHNTVSYGSWTLIGAPALFGGYDYTPENINARDGESLVSKHNESLRVMPVLFGENGFKVTVCDPSYAGYKMVPDLSIYNDHPEFNVYITNGRFDYFGGTQDGARILDTINRMNEMRNRNFYCFALMKISPLILQETIYDDGGYNESDLVTGVSDDNFNTTLTQHLYGISRSVGYFHDFINAYAVLDNLPKITTVNDSSENTFLMMENDTAHAPCLLQEPDYVPAMNVDNTAYDVDMVDRYTVDGKTMMMETDKQVIHYHSNMATFLKLGEWFDYLRENGVYDNTRIILVADHGRDLDQFHVFCDDKDLEFFMPLLMVKDFNATGFTVSDEFMTNGDTPALATKDLIEDPVNPFTGNPINSDYKNGPQNIFFSDFIDSTEVTGNVFPAGSWFTYEGDDPLDVNNWKYVDDH
ncbi:MAG: membrane protein insertase YidC [Clostridiales bacterium]|nr:membrane protein insertase YidC [Clostridiales bacterium]